ncbi:MAG: DegT/DnrJ/EryC1/StrS family aminotransferase [Opitutales bacterium]|nr:DegT/DnrJ/EryC1/StrS family aminotransferase [Opitutales bacterium]
MAVPLFTLARHNQPLREELHRTFEKVLDSGMYILGKEVAEFEAELAHANGLSPDQVIGVSSGTDALLLALMTMDIGPGDEVVCPSFSFFATAGCIARVGAKPVFADVCPVCFNLDPDSFAASLTPRTKAVIPVHLFGQCAEMDRINEIAKDHGIMVLEDAAQALSARYRGKPAGTMGDFGAFSFFPTKNLGGFGDGGALFAHDPALAHKARLMRVHGGHPKYYHSMIGGNFRLDALQAALLRVKLPHLADFSAARATHAKGYQDTLLPNDQVFLPSEGQCHCLKDPASPNPNPSPRKLWLPHAYQHNDSIWNQFTILVDGPGAATGEARDSLQKHLRENGVGAEIYYPVPLHQQECFASSEKPELPIADSLAARCLSLPIFPEMTPDERHEVIQTLLSWLHQK